MRFNAGTSTGQCRRSVTMSYLLTIKRKLKIIIINIVFLKLECNQKLSLADVDFTCQAVKPVADVQMQCTF